jgi:hypothetical protein
LHEQPSIDADAGLLEASAFKPSAKCDSSA